MTNLHKRTITEYISIPEHDDRTASYEFKENRKKLIYNRAIGCYICGSQNKQEAHHILEWSLWNALDPVKALNVLKLFDFHGYAKLDPDTPLTTPDDIRNLVLLCGEYTTPEGKVVMGGHHRGFNFGIHELTFPIWLAQKAVKDGLSITNAIEKIKQLDSNLVNTKQTIKK
jgi:hypothetical protein